MLTIWVYTGDAIYEETRAESGLFKDSFGETFQAACRDIVADGGLHAVDTIPDRADDDAGGQLWIPLHRIEMVTTIDPKKVEPAMFAGKPVSERRPVYKRRAK